MKERLFIRNIGTLAGITSPDTCCKYGDEMSEFTCLHQAWLIAEDGMIKEYGTAEKAPQSSDKVIDAEEGFVLPAFCDSHTHLVYADSREKEFVDKINGLSYSEIAARGGGILNSAARLHQLSEEALYLQASNRVKEIIRKGTGAVEIKSGYGLNTADEIKMLHVIRRIKEEMPIKVVSTFLGAHAVGRAFAGRQAEYVDYVINDMIPNVAKEGLADFIDVFCDRGFFTPEETDRILEAGSKYGMRPKIHASELAATGGVAVGVRHYALSIDHLESVTDEEIALLAQARTITVPTVLPGTSFFLNMPYAPARKLINAGLAVAIASDYNPGSTPSGDMKFAMSLACIKMRLCPAEALNAATINAAHAMGLGRELGSIAVGKRAHLILTDRIPSLDYIPYAYTSPIIKKTIIGETVIG